MATAFPDQKKPGAPSPDSRTWVSPSLNSSGSDAPSLFSSSLIEHQPSHLHPLLLRSHPQIPLRLHTQPEVCLHSERILKPKSHLCRNRSPPVDHPRQGPASHTEMLCQRSNRAVTHHAFDQQTQLRRIVHFHRLSPSGSPDSPRERHRSPQRCR